MSLSVALITLVISSGTVHDKNRLIMYVLFIT